MTSEETEESKEVNNESESTTTVTLRVKNVTEINNCQINESPQPSSSQMIKRKLPCWLGSTQEVNTKKRTKSQDKIKSEPSDSNTLNNEENECLPQSEGIDNPGSAESSATENANGTKRINLNSADEPQASSSSGNLRFPIKTEKADPEPDSAVGHTNPPIAAVAVVKEEASSTTRDSCKFGIRCYRRNPQHRMEEAHPGDSDYRRPNYPTPPKGTPDCPFGDRCYRRNPAHFQEYAHPPSS